MMCKSFVAVSNNFFYGFPGFNGEQLSVWTCSRHGEPIEGAL